MISKVFLGFGSNIGNRFINLKTAVEKISLTQGIDFLAVSRVYQTEPWGYKKQPVFLNCAGVFLCRHNHEELVKTIKKIEKNIGRVKRGKWQAREIDIDVLFYGSNIYKTGYLVIPHPLIQQRNFVLKPLVELIPDFVHPVLKKSISYLYFHSKDNSEVTTYKKEIVG
jgi:2-amino-4-hydroxy-6-hydroxymethyldihydropteridine diphosphokinase